MGVPALMSLYPMRLTYKSLSCVRENDSVSVEIMVGYMLTLNETSMQATGPHA